MEVRAVWGFGGVTSVSQRTPTGVGTEYSLGFSPGGSGDAMWLLERGERLRWV